MGARTNDLNIFKILAMALLLYVIYTILFQVASCTYCDSNTTKAAKQ